MSSTKQTNPKRTAFSFAAIDTYVEQSIILPVEKVIQGKDMVEWGDRNAYPNYLLELYNNVPTLRSIINGNIDYVAGDDVTILPLQPEFTSNEMNTRGDTIREQVKDIAKDFEIYGGFALQVIRNLAGEVAEVYYIDMRYLRTNKEGDVFYYSEKWGKSGKTDVMVYPAFIPKLDWATLSDEQRARHASSILFVKNVHTQVYPAPLYAASVRACEIERLIDVFHLSDINNHFVSSAIINFNNGDPGDEMKSEIEEECAVGTRTRSPQPTSWNSRSRTSVRGTRLSRSIPGHRYSPPSVRFPFFLVSLRRQTPDSPPRNSSRVSNSTTAHRFSLSRGSSVTPMTRFMDKRVSSPSDPSQWMGTRRTM